MAIMGMVIRIRVKPRISSQEKRVFKNRTEIITEPMGSSGGQHAACQTAHNTASALKKAEGEDSPQNDDAGQQQIELAAELDALHLPRAKDQQHDAAADGHAPSVVDRTENFCISFRGDTV